MTPMSLTLNTFLEYLASHDDDELVFHFEGRQINPGYHVTELKAVTVLSIDCGARRDSWIETQVVLLDGAHHRGTYMTAGRFSDIARKSLRALPQLGGAPLFFEFDASKYRATIPTRNPGQVMVPLAAEQAVCKPMQDNGCRPARDQSACCSA